MRMCTQKCIIWLCALIVVALLLGLLLRTTGVTVSPLTEADAMRQLAIMQQQTTHAPFTSDGCSGNVSAGWKQVIQLLSETSEEFSRTYANAESIPFESACIAHDQSYHLGNGGYVGRLRADMKLRTDIIEYAITNVSTIKERTGLTTDEQVIFLYEILAEAVYRGVRLGGAPCTGMPYAWGYGYGGGSCATSAL